MEYKKRKLIEAFETNEINRVLLIDDAYDPPDLDDTAVGHLADLLDKENGRDVCVECGIGQSTLEAATIAAEVGEADNEALMSVFCALYAKFAETGDGRFDLGGQFSVQKGSVLAILQPLEALLQECGETVQVVTTGRVNAEVSFRDFCPQMIFLDFYLDDDVPPGNVTVSDETKSSARQASLDLLRVLLSGKSGVDSTDVPAIVLMSSRRDLDVIQYRHDAGGQILSLRFNFLQKDLVRQEDSNIVVEDDAADALLDTSQGYLFGEQIQRALRQWKKGTEAALDDFINEVKELHLRDFAYLLRFRLREEGQPFGEYLEWFFGESLKGMIEKKVNWMHPSFSVLNNDHETGKLIEGAFDGPSNIIATNFCRVRVYSRHRRDSSDYRLGDLYTRTEESSIWVVITPDCDLIKRNGKMKAKSILTMVGTLDTFDNEDSSADDFLIRDDGFFSLRWDPKNLETFLVNNPESSNGIDTMEYIGTLRPMYAQEIQSRVLTDLTRVGLPVAPAFGINAIATVWFQSVNGFKQIEIAGSSSATVIPPRAGKNNRPRILLRRRFFNQLIKQLKKIDGGEVKAQHRDLLRNVLEEEGTLKLHEGYLRDGLPIDDKIYGTGFVIGTQPNCGNKAPWLQIVLDISDSDIESIETMDPVLDPIG